MVTALREPHPQRKPSPPVFPSQVLLSSFLSSMSAMLTANPPSFDCFVSLVEMKCRRHAKCYSFQSYSPGSWVVIPSQRGKVCGIVIFTGRWDGARSELVEPSVYRHYVVPPVHFPTTEKTTFLPILSLLEGPESELFFTFQESRERVCLRAARVTATRLKLPLEFFDCELQLDGEQITFFYCSPSTVQFGHLLKELFRLFHTRIWLHNTYKTTAYYDYSTMLKARIPVDSSYASFLRSRTP